MTSNRLLTGFTGDVGSEWAYRGGLTKAPLGANEGISSTGLNWFGKKNLFPGKSIPKSGSLNGIQFGLTTAFDLPGNDLGNIKNQSLIENSVIFTSPGCRKILLSRTSLASHSNTVRASNNQNLPGIAVVPEPTPLMLVAAGMGLLTLTSRRRTK